MNAIEKDKEARHYAARNFANSLRALARTLEWLVVLGIIAAIFAAVLQIISWTVFIIGVLAGAGEISIVIIFIRAAQHALTMLADIQRDAGASAAANTFTAEEYKRQLRSGLTEQPASTADR